MSSDVEQHLRRALEDEARTAPAPRDAAGAVRRVRLRQVGTVAGGTVIAIALVVAGVVGARTLDGGGGTTPAAPTLTGELNGITIAYPEGWALVDPDEAGLNGGLPEDPDSLPRLVLLLVPSPPGDTFGCPAVAESEEAATFVLSVQEEPLALDGPGSTPWPTDLTPMANGPTEDGCYGGWEFRQAEFSTAGRSFDVRIGIAPGISEAEREAVFDAYASMAFAATPRPTSVVLASGFGGGEEWEFVAHRGPSGLELSVDTSTGGSGGGGFRPDTTLSVFVGQSGGPGSPTFVFGAVSREAVRVEVEPSSPSGASEVADVLDVPDDIDPDLNAFVVALPAATSGQVRALNATGDVLAFEPFGGALECPEVPVSSGASDGRSIASAEEAEDALRNALAAAKTFFTDCADYGALSPDAIDAIEPSFAYDDGPSASTSVISVRPVGTRALVLVARADDGSVRCLAEDLDADIVAYGTTDASVPRDCAGGWPGQDGTG